MLIEDVEPEREPGLVHPSPLVRYEDIGGNAPGTVYDYCDEYAGIGHVPQMEIPEVVSERVLAWMDANRLSTPAS